MKLGLSKEKMQKHVDAINNSDDKSTAIVKSVQSMLDDAKDQTVKEYQNMFDQVQINKENSDKFGLRLLSTEEEDFYQKVTEGYYTDAENTDVIPETVINHIFEDLKRARPLFQYINFAPAGLKKWITGEVTGAAVWGELGSKITEELKATLKEIPLDAYKLSAFALVPSAIIDLGFQWVDKYVREALIEANAEGIENGIVNGDGKQGPIGLTRKLNGLTDSGYPLREAVKITAFTPLGLADILAGLTNNGKRTVSKIVLVVNPLDDFKLVKPASTFLSANGDYKTSFPIPTEVVQSIGVPAGKAVVMLPNSYDAGISKMGIYTSDTFKFLDHVRTYKVVTYGNGRIKNEDMAVLLDITALEPLKFNVETPAGETIPGA